MNDENKRYPTICPNCNSEIYVCRSLGMLVGWMDDGGGTCPKCKKHCDIKYDRKRDVLTAYNGKRSKRSNLRGDIND